MIKLYGAAQRGMWLLFSGAVVWAQFVSGSDGTDGKLDYTGRTGTVVFDPATIPNHPVGSLVFNFTTITIPDSLSVSFKQSVLNGPVIWLAQGAVNIGYNAILGLAGARGSLSFPTALRALAEPGAGGYPGGAGRGAYQSSAGMGPGGGVACSTGVSATGGKYTGNPFAIPLVGGSGGGGGCANGGGAGGGAILIASSVSIENRGSIYVYGGHGGDCSAGAGSGGVVRLIAPSLAAGTIHAYGGHDTCTGIGPRSGTGGAIRLESLNNPGVTVASISSPQPTVSYGSPFETFVTSSVGSTVKVVSVNGVAVASPATGSFQLPDVTIANPAQVTLQIQATQVPVGTVVNLLFFSDNGPDIAAVSTPLGGTLALSTATANVTFPAGFTRGFVSASF